MHKATSLLLLLAALPLAAQVPGAEAPPSVPPSVPQPAAGIQPQPDPVPAPPEEPQMILPPDFQPGIPPPPVPAPAPVPAGTVTTVEASLQSAQLRVGEESALTFNFTGGSPDAPPQSISVPGLDIRLLGMNSHPFTAGGRPVLLTELTYSIEALEAGERTIPEQVFTAGGKELKSKALKLTVKEGDPIDEALQPQAQVSVAKTEMWEGEAVQVSVRVLMHRAINIISQPFPVFTSDGLAVSRFDRNFGSEMLRMGDDLWNSWSLQSALIPLRSGDLKLGPGEVKLEVYMPVLGAARDQFGGGPATRRALKVKTNSLSLHVKPLPEEGRPDGFSGAVGNFQVIARAESTSGAAQTIELGNPIGFEIMVTGTGNFDAVNAPVIENPDGLRIYKARTSLENRGLGTEMGQKGFTQILFPDKPGPLNIVYQLPSFDPQTGKYVWAKSQPISFMITGDPVKVAAEQKANDAQTKDYTGVIEALEPGEELQDILPHAVSGGRWFQLATVSPPVSPWLLHGAPAVFLLGLLGIGASRRMKAWQAANRPPDFAPRTLSEIAAALRAPGLPRLQFYSLVSEYIHAWTFWKKQPPPLPAAAPAWSDLLAARDRWLYAANAEAAAAPVPADEQSAAAATLLSRLSA